MSTQSTPSILFTHRSPQQGFRLLELPPDLAELLASEDPPVLELKSPSPSTTAAPSTTATNGTGTAPNPATDYVNLCTANKTYSIRQVHSSNSLHILRPSHGGAVKKGDLKIVGAAKTNGEDENIDMDADDHDNEEEQEVNLDIEGTVTSISKCGSTLELHTPAEGFSAKPFLIKALRVYDRGLWEDEGQSHDNNNDDIDIDGPETKNILKALFADIPVSSSQCERDWVDTCALVRSTQCYRPSAEMKLEVWKRVVEGSVLQGINLGSQFLVSDLWKSVLDDEGLAPFPRGLFEAVVGRVREVGEGRERGLSEVNEMKWASIDKEVCVRWVGEVYLEAMANGPTSAIGESDLISAWKDQLPEAWREDVAISILPESCIMRPEPKTICFANEGDRQKAKKNLPTDASAATTAKKTRNWHELFKNQKRQKR
ncbi:putative sister chromatid cohesion protein Dcc1 [Aspergillus stella-maris]|uniref:putative sister chromatid cohesion protein Dcc1 n=1 Tax=Aspergillus stella-maris TaxID=1810926 RepID=UPI003CCCACCC